MKSTPWVNFINILHVHFSRKSKLSSFSLVTFWLWQKDLGNKHFCTKNARIKCWWNWHLERGQRLRRSLPCEEWLSDRRWRQHWSSCHAWKWPSSIWTSCRGSIQPVRGQTSEGLTSAGLTWSGIDQMVAKVGGLIGLAPVPPDVLRVQVPRASNPLPKLIPHPILSAYNEIVSK